MTTWRRYLHAYKEIAFEQIRTADFVATKLERFDIAGHQCLEKMGVVETLSNGTGGAIGLRANIDALDID